MKIDGFRLLFDRDESAAQIPTEEEGFDKKPVWLGEQMIKRKVEGKENKVGDVIVVNFSLKYSSYYPLAKFKRKYEKYIEKEI